MPSDQNNRRRTELERELPFHRRAPRGALALAPATVRTLPASRPDRPAALDYSMASRKQRR